MLMVHLLLNLIKYMFFFRVASKDPSVLSQEEEEVFGLLERGVLVSLYHTTPIQIYDVPKQKRGYMEAPVLTDVCAYGIYPDLPRIEEAGRGPEKHVFSWNLDKKLVMTSFR